MMGRLRSDRLLRKGAPGHLRTSYGVAAMIVDTIRTATEARRPLSNVEAVLLENLTEELLARAQGEGAQWMFQQFDALFHKHGMGDNDEPGEAA